MHKWTKTAGLLFLAASSVYAGREIVGTTATVAYQANGAKSSPASANAAPAADNPSTDVKLLEDSNSNGSADPFAAAPATTQPVAAGAATTQPAAAPQGGKSVSNSEVSVSDAGTVEIHVNDANLVEVLRMMSLQSQRNIIASKEVRGTVTANLYDVTVREALDAILHANGYAYKEKGNFVYVYTQKELAEIEKAERQAKTEVFHLYYTPAANAANMIKPVLSSTGQVALTMPTQAGIGSSATSSGGNDHANEDVLVVTDYPENIEAARKVLAEVDKRPQQILLEATILRATLNEDNALGVDFNILGGVDLSTITSGNGQITNANIADGASPGRIHSVGTGNSFTSPINGGLKVGYITDSVSVFLSALEQVTDTTVLANPKILALNKQKGEVFVGNEDGYYTTVTTETTTSQSVESLKTGTRLIFRPYVGSDGFIRLEVHPEDSDGQVKANGLPSKTTTEVTSNVMVKDGHTIVIGGLFRESTQTARSQVPFLGNLPLAGNLFRNHKDHTVREEVIILLTPHIVKDESAYAAMSEEQLKHAEDLRVGVRKGMMPWGRERLAESEYEAARKELAKKNPDRKVAIWHLESATNLNPKFTEAIELKEQLSGKVVTDSDGTSIRGFVREAILRDIAVMAPTTMPTTRASSEDPDLTAMDTPVAMPEDEKANNESATTQPSDAVAEESPATTQPAGEATAKAPSTQPTKAVEQAVAPSTQPANVRQAVAPSTQPAKVAEQAAAPTTQSSEDVVVIEDEPSASPATSQPTASKSREENAKDVTVTELPQDDAVPDQTSDDQPSK